jgi:transposase-like protein
VEVEGIKRRHLSSNEWRGLLDRFAAGSESVSAFCRREGVSANSFRRWRDRLSVKASGSPAPINKAHADAAPGFVDLGSLGVTAVPTTRLELTLDLGAGVTLHVVRG